MKLNRRFMADEFHILLLNGPNLNLLGNREVNKLNKYGCTTLAEIIIDMINLAASLGVKLSYFQSNAEHTLIDHIHIHEARGNKDLILINAFTHTSVALRDAFLAVNIPFIEIHLSNIYAREPFRHYSYLSDIAVGVICGFGVDGYNFALQTAVKLQSKYY